MSLLHPVTILFLQLLLILVFCRGAGWAACRVGQPRVVGEMIAGVLLGPSLFGLVAPTAQAWLFRSDSLRPLYMIAQIGVSLYMFLVGVEFRTEVFRARVRGALVVSFAGMAVPFLMAVALTPWFCGMPGLFAPKTTPLIATLFLGAAMAITAFPVLARIIHERGLTGTPLGTLALSAGAIDDAAAWCLLAVVLALINGSVLGAMTVIVGGLVYAVITLTLGRELLGRLAEQTGRAQRLSSPMLFLILALVAFGAWVTDFIGVHAVLGGFLIGAAMPRGLLASELRRRLEPGVVVFLVPVFFAFAGLNTKLGLLGGGGLWLVATSLLLASIIGKGVACWAAARLTGEEPRTAWAIGTLMNARGLMELLIANIGLQQGVIQPAMFSMLVLMAVLTTLMTSPLLKRFHPAMVAGTLEPKSGIERFPR